MRDMQTVRQQSVSQQRHISLNEQESDIKGTLSYMSSFFFFS